MMKTTGVCAEVRGTSISSAYTVLTLLSSSLYVSVSTSLRASEVEPEPHQTQTRGDVIFIGEGCPLPL